MPLNNVNDIYFELLTAFNNLDEFHKTKQRKAKPTQQKLLNQIYLTKFIEPNQTYRHNLTTTTKLIKLNLPNQIDQD